MSSQLTIENPGLSTTVQDLGRYGFQAQGIPVAGAVDPFLMQRANIAVGNASDAAVLEFSLSGLVFSLTQERNVFVGGNCRVLKDGATQAPSQSFKAEANQRIEIQALNGHRFGVIAIEGGIDTPLSMGSRATYTKAGLGGFDGRALMAGDSLPVGPANGRQVGIETSASVADLSAPLRLVLGPQHDAFTDEAIDVLQTGTFVTTDASDRMGCRLQGPILTHKQGPDILSDGIAYGSVQVPGSGEPIVLLNDRQTIGGYTKIATLLSIDAPKLAQSLPGTSVRFDVVTPQQAVGLTRDALTAFGDELEQLAKATPALSLNERLATQNIVGGFVDAIAPSRIPNNTNVDGA